jgi:hypothetical protein
VWPKDERQALKAVALTTAESVHDDLHRVIYVPLVFVDPTRRRLQQKLRMGVVLDLGTPVPGAPQTSHGRPFLRDAAAKAHPRLASANSYSAAGISY